MRDYYTYCYLREDGTPYYIGSGRGPRIDRRRTGLRVELPPLNRRLKLKQNLTQEESFKHEQYMIDVLGRKDLGTGPLLNRTGGGKGLTNPSQETRTRIGDKLKGKSYLTEEGRKSISRHNSGENNYFHTHKFHNSTPCSQENKNKFHKMYSSWFVFTDPEGVEHQVFTTLKRWCEEHNLTRQGMNQVMRGESKTHKGWTVRKLVTPPI